MGLSYTITITTITLLLSLATIFDMKGYVSHRANVIFAAIYSALCFIPLFFKVFLLWRNKRTRWKIVLSDILRMILDEFYYTVNFYLWGKGLSLYCDIFNEGREYRTNIYTFIAKEDDIISSGLNGVDYKKVEGGYKGFSDTYFENEDLHSLKEQESNYFDGVYSMEKDGRKRKIIIALRNFNEGNLNYVKNECRYLNKESSKGSTVGDNSIYLFYEKPFITELMGEMVVKVTYSESTKDLDLIYKNEKFQGEKKMRLSNSSIEDFSNAILLFKYRKNCSTLDFTYRYKKRREAFLFHSICDIKCVEMMRSGFFLWEINIETEGMPCYIEDQTIELGLGKKMEIIANVVKKETFLATCTSNLLSKKYAEDIYKYITKFTTDEEVRNKLLIGNCVNRGYKFYRTVLNNWQRKKFFSDMNYIRQKNNVRTMSKCDVLKPSRLLRNMVENSEILFNLEEEMSVDEEIGFRSAFEALKSKGEIHSRRQAAGDDPKKPRKNLREVLGKKYKKKKEKNSGDSNIEEAKVSLVNFSDDNNKGKATYSEILKKAAPMFPKKEGKGKEVNDNKTIIFNDLYKRLGENYILDNFKPRFKEYMKASACERMGKKEKGMKKERKEKNKRQESDDLKEDLLVLENSSLKNIKLILGPKRYRTDFLVHEGVKLLDYFEERNPKLKGRRISCQAEEGKVGGNGWIRAAEVRRKYSQVLNNKFLIPEGNYYSPLGDLENEKDENVKRTHSVAKFESEVRNWVNDSTKDKNINKKIGSKKMDKLLFNQSKSHLNSFFMKSKLIYSLDKKFLGSGIKGGESLKKSELGEGKGGVRMNKEGDKKEGEQKEGRESCKKGGDDAVNPVEASTNLNPTPPPKKTGEERIEEIKNLIKEVYKDKTPETSEKRIIKENKEKELVKEMKEINIELKRRKKEEAEKQKKIKKDEKKKNKGLTEKQAPKSSDEMRSNG